MAEDNFKVERQGGFLLAKVHHLAGRVFTKMLKAHDITEINPAQGRILFVLWQQDGLSIQALARRTALGKSTLTSMLDRLDESGFIRRERDTQDRRKILIWRTEKDRAYQAAYERVSREMLDLFYTGLEEHEVEQFERTLERLLANLTSVENEGEV